VPADSVSVIVTTHDCAPLLSRTLDSLRAALEVFARQHPAIPAEVVVVDDGSSDDTPQVAQRHAQSRPGWQLVRRPRPTSPSCARNTGVRHARGSVLFFLDGDDLFLPDHLVACYQALQADGLDFVKSGVRLADPVHPDWRPRIEHSLVLNLCLHRRCHEAVGGFPDWHLFRRDGEEMRHVIDIFLEIEDMFYNSLLADLFRGGSLAEQTVEYCRHPGNFYDRQYEKFRRPYGQHPEGRTEDERFRLRLAEMLTRERLPRLVRRPSGVPGNDGARTVLAARRARESGDHPQAERLCWQALADAPGDVGAWLLLATVLLDQGKAGEALQAGEQALRRDPDSAEGHFQLGQALQAQGQREPARRQLAEAVRLRPEHAEAHSALGLLLARQNRLEEAEAHLAEAVRLRPEQAALHHNLGVCLAQRGRAEEGIASLRRALELRPDYAEACYNLGAVLVEAGRREEGIAAYQRALELRPGYGEAYNNLGLALSDADRHGEAVVILQQAVRLRPQAPEGHNNLGLALAGAGRFREAEAAYAEALRRDPGYAEAHNNLGSALKEQGRLEEALAAYQVALWHNPRSASTHYNRSLALLAAGQWEEGWREYEWRWQRGRMMQRPFRQPPWDGSALNGRTILLWSEQGLGDTIQFARYAAVVKGRGGRVVLECPGCLVPLFRSLPGVDVLVAEEQPVPEFDVQVPLMSLPGLLGVTVQDVLVVEPYLKVVPEREALWRQRLQEVRGFRVGVAWQGNPRFAWDRWRSFPLRCLQPLAEVEGVSLISLQKGPGIEQLAGVRERFAVRVLGEELDAEGAFVDTAAVMKGLDLVVSADTATAHVAGALGVPVWLALSQVCDWRWLRDREDSPWYPGMRLWRQERLEDWEGIFARMADRIVETKRQEERRDRESAGQSTATG
jgi:tetratricopeptide (TPR) repeat protein